MKTTLTCAVQLGVSAHLNLADTNETSLFSHLKIWSWHLLSDNWDDEYCFWPDSKLSSLEDYTYYDIFLRWTLLSHWHFICRLSGESLLSPCSLSFFPHLVAFNLFSGNYHSRILGHGPGKPLCYLILIGSLPMPLLFSKYLASGGRKFPSKNFWIRNCVLLPTYICLFPICFHVSQQRWVTLHVSNHFCGSLPNINSNDNKNDYSLYLYRHSQFKTEVWLL